MYATVGAACMDDGRCYVRNDGKTVSRSLRCRCPPPLIPLPAVAKQFLPPAKSCILTLFCGGGGFPTLCSPSTCFFFGLQAFVGSLRITLVELATGNAAWTSTQPLSIARGAHTVQWVCVKGSYAPSSEDGNCTGWDQILAEANQCTRSTCVANFDVLGPAGVAPLSSNQQLLLPPGNLKVAMDAVVTTVVGEPNSVGLIPVTVTATATAVLVTLTTLSSGVFSDNVFLLTQHTPVELLFTPYGLPDAAALRSSLRTVHLAQYL